MPQKQITVRLDEELHKWVKLHIRDFRPRTTMSNFVAWLIEMYKEEHDNQAFIEKTSGLNDWLTKEKS
jgi:hypothetical protein